MRQGSAACSKGPRHARTRCHALPAPSTEPALPSLPRALLPARRAAPALHAPLELLSLSVHRLERKLCRLLAELQRRQRPPLILLHRLQVGTTGGRDTSSRSAWGARRAGESCNRRRGGGSAATGGAAGRGGFKVAYSCAAAAAVPHKLSCTLCPYVISTLSINCVDRSLVVMHGSPAGP